MEHGPRELFEPFWFVALSVAASFYAAALWGFFARLRVQNRQWWWAVFDVVMVVAAVVYGISFWQVTFGSDRDFWRGFLRVLFPVMVLIPAVMHYVFWRASMKFVSRAEAVEDADLERHRSTAEEGGDGEL